MTSPQPQAPWRSGILWGVMITGLAVMVLGVVLASGFGRDPDLVASPLIGEPAPPVSLPYLEFPGLVSLDELRGDVVVVNFWSSWCLACREEHQALIAAAGDYAELGVTFVGVLYQDDANRGLDFLSELGRGEPYVYLHDEDSRAALDFGVLGLPETFFIDRQGMVIGKVIGPVGYPLLAATLDSIILGESIDTVVKTGDVENRG